MSRPLRAELDPGVYHLCTRGAGGIPIVHDDDDRLLFLHLLRREIRRKRWRCHAWCLMTNHYHLLIQTRKPNLSAGMHVLNGTYARGFNERYGRRGHLFGARFYSGEVEGDLSFERTQRYIVENPVRAGMCSVSSDYLWSGFDGLVIPGGHVR